MLYTCSCQVSKFNYFMSYLSSIGISQTTIQYLMNQPACFYEYNLSCVFSYRHLNIWDIQMCTHCLLKTSKSLNSITEEKRIVIFLQLNLQVWLCFSSTAQIREVLMSPEYYSIVWVNTIADLRSGLSFGLVDNLDFQTGNSYPEDDIVSSVIPIPPNIPTQVIRNTILFWPWLDSLQFWRSIFKFLQSISYRIKSFTTQKVGTY